MHQGVRRWRAAAEPERRAASPVRRGGLRRELRNPAVQCPVLRCRLRAWGVGGVDAVLEGLWRRDPGADEASYGTARRQGSNSAFSSLFLRGGALFSHRQRLGDKESEREKKREHACSQKKINYECILHRLHIS